MIDLEQQFEQAWGAEPALPHPLDRLAAGKQRLRRRRVASTTFGAVAAVAVIVAGSAMIGGGTPRSAPPEFATSSPSATPSQSSAEQYEVAPWPYSDVEQLPLWSDDHHIYRSASGVEVERTDGVTIRDAVTGEDLGDQLFLQTIWKGERRITYFEQVDGKILGSGSVGAPWDSALRSADLRPEFYDKFPGGFELFTDPIGLELDGSLKAKTGAIITSERSATAGEYSTQRFDASPPHVGEVTIAGLHYYAIAGYTSASKDVIWTEQTDGRSLDQFLAEVKRGMDDGSIVG